MKRKQTEIVLSAQDRAALERIAADGNERQKIVKRARIVLLTAQGHGVMAIMRAVGVSKTTVWRWQDYFVAAGVSGLVKARSKPRDRTEPGCPLNKGRAGTLTHDYKRNGTTTLFAALDVASGKVIGQCLPRPRAKEFLAFLKKLARDIPAHLDLPLIVDNYSTHKTEAVKRWLKRNPRCKLHFTPTSSSWLNLVERLVAEIDRPRIRPGPPQSAAELQPPIVEWTNHRHAHPNPPL